MIYLARNQGKETHQTGKDSLIMKTVEIVKTANGTYVTRRYGGQNKGMAFFYSIKPASAKTKLTKPQFIKDQKEKMDKYIKEWMGE
jgi:hypothetical protein